MTAATDDFGFISFTDLEKDKDEFGFVPFTPEKTEDFSFQEQMLQENQMQEFPEKDFVSDEEVQRNIERAQAQLLSRGTEAVLGAPGDIASFLTGLFGKQQNILPTSGELQQASEQVTSGYTAPQSPFEETGGELFSDIATMALPGSGHYSFARNIGIPVVGTLVKEGLKYGNADERSQAYGKAGIMLALDLLSRRAGGLKSFVSSLFKKAEEAVPKGVSVKATDLDKSLTNLEKELTAGGERATTKKALEKVKEIKEEIKEGKGKIDLKRLAAYRPSINEAIDELGGFHLEVPRKLKPQTIRNLNSVKSEVIKTLDQYGEKFNPEFAKFHQSANEAYAAMKQSEKISNFLRNKIGYSPTSKAVQALFSIGSHIGLGALATLSPGTALTALGGSAIYQAIKIFSQVKNSKTLRKYYSNVLKEAAAGNVAETTKNLRALDISMQKQELDENLE